MPLESRWIQYLCRSKSDFVCKFWTMLIVISKIIISEFGDMFRDCMAKANLDQGREGSPRQSTVFWVTIELIMRVSRCPKWLLNVINRGYAAWKNVDHTYGHQSASYSIFQMETAISRIGYNQRQCTVRRRKSLKRDRRIAKESLESLDRQLRWLIVVDDRLVSRVKLKGLRCKLKGPSDAHLKCIRMRNLFKKPVCKS